MHIYGVDEQKIQERKQREDEGKKQNQKSKKGAGEIVSEVGKDKWVDTHRAECYRDAGSAPESNPAKGGGKRGATTEVAEGVPEGSIWMTISGEFDSKGEVAASVVSAAVEGKGGGSSKPAAFGRGSESVCCAMRCEDDAPPPPLTDAE